MKTVWIVALDGLMDSSLAITLDLLRTAQAICAQSRRATPFVYRVLGARAQLRTGAGLTLRTDDTFRQALAGGDPAPDWVVVPALGEYGGRLTEHLRRPDAVQAMRLLASLHARKARIAASCAAVFVLAQAGLLAQRTVTTTWWLSAAFRQRHPDVHLDERRMVVRDGSLLTAGSAFAHLDLMLAVLGDLCSATVADQCARYLLIDRRPSQARYMATTHLLRQDPVVAAAERWVDEHLPGPISVRALSAAMAMSEKTFSRKVHASAGVSPIRLIQQRRLAMAVHLIESTRTPIEEVAVQVGYRDSTTLRRLVRRDLGTSPSALR